MSKIIATDHFETQNWEVIFEDLAPTSADLFIGFTNDAPVVEFKGLKFKYELKQVNIDMIKEGEEETEDHMVDSEYTIDELKIEFEKKMMRHEDENIKQYGSYPSSGVKYVRSDQPFIVVERLNLQVETEYELYLWAENDGQSFETTVTFTTPRPEQPYPSWDWDGENWNAPIPMPDDRILYYWDEISLNWIKVEYDE